MCVWLILFLFRIRLFRLIYRNHQSRDRKTVFTQGGVLEGITHESSATARESQRQGIVVVVLAKDIPSVIEPYVSAKKDPPGRGQGLPRGELASRKEQGGIWVTPLPGAGPGAPGPHRKRLCDYSKVSVYRSLRART